MSGRPSCVVTSSMRLARRTSLGAPLLLAGRWTHTAPPVRTRALSPAHHTRMYPTRFLKPMCRSHHERARAEAARLALCEPRLGGCPHTRLGGCGCPHSIGRSFRRKTTDTTQHTRADYMAAGKRHAGVSCRRNVASVGPIVLIAPSTSCDLHVLTVTASPSQACARHRRPRSSCSQT